MRKQIKVSDIYQRLIERQYPPVAGYMAWASSESISNSSAVSGTDALMPHPGSVDSQ